MGFGVLLHAQSSAEIREIGERLLLSANQATQLCLLVERYAHKEVLSRMSPSEFTFEMETLHPALLYVLLLLWLEDDAMREKIINLHARWRKIKPVLNGNDLQALGIPTGPLYTRLLTAVRAARIDGLVHTKENEIAWVHKLLHEWGQDG